MNKEYYVSLSEEQAAALGLSQMDEAVYCFTIADVADTYDRLRDDEEEAWCLDHEDDEFPPPFTKPALDELSLDQQRDLIHQAESALEDTMGDWTDAVEWDTFEED